MIIKSLITKSLTAVICTAFAFALTLGISPAQAEYPEKPIKIVVGFGAGGGATVLARLVAKELEADLGQPIVVENKPGGGGVVAATGLMNAKPDGYTVGFAVNSTFAFVPLISKKIKYGPEDFDYPTTVAALQNAIISGADVPYSTWPEMIAHAKAGNSVSFASTSPAVKAVLQYVMHRDGIKIKIVPVKGGKAAMKEVLGGHIDMAWSAGIHQAYLKSKKIKVLAASGPERLATTPKIPTLLEMGYDFGLGGYFMFFTPKGIPADIFNKLSKALYKASSAPEVAKLAEEKMGFPNTVMTPEETMAMVMGGLSDYKRLLAAAKGDFAK